MGDKGIEWEGVDWIYQSRDTERWQAVIDNLMTGRVHKMMEISWLNENFLNLQERF
jgi:hypothetical protein